MSDEITPESRVMFLSGDTPLSRAQLMAMLAAVIPPGMEIDTGRRRAPEPAHTVPTEREMWNLKVEAKKLAKKGRK